MEVNVAMKNIPKEHHNIIDFVDSHKTLFELKNEFYIKYNGILRIQNDPLSGRYHSLYNQFWDIHSKIRDIMYIAEFCVTLG